MQLAIERDAAAVRANAAILAVAAKAERKSAGWVELALAELGEYARAASSNGSYKPLYRAGNA